MKAEHLQIRSGGVELAGERWGGDGPAVVLLHSGVTDRRGWRDVARHLANLANVVSYDRRGFGDTPPAAGPYTHLRDLLAVLDQAASGAAWLVGSSAGGGLALDMAVVEPARVAGLVLLAPSVSGAPEPVNLDPDTQRISDLLDRAGAAGDLDVVNRLETWLWLDGPAGPEGRVTGKARELALAMNDVVLGHGVPGDSGASGVDAWNRLEEVQAPTTVACGALDVPFLVRRCEELVARLPHAQHRVLAGTAHLPYLDQPDLVAEVIAQALTLPTP